jgi:hypothetical protein
MTPRAFAIGVAVVTLVAVVGTEAHASDYYHTCRSADGRYQLDDGALFRSNSDASSGKELSYTALQETLLKRETGYCITLTGKKYDFEFKSYIKRIKFSDDGQAYEFDMVCELAADGLPANESCKKNIITSSTGIGSSLGAKGVDEIKPAPGTQGWSHNGSDMKLIANGNKRRFVYEKPRPGLGFAGIKRGDVVFDGARSGMNYSGTAYIFKKGCDPQGYPVSGNVGSDEQSVTMTGKRPKIGDGCRVTKYEDDTLVFELPDQGTEAD